MKKFNQFKSSNQGMGDLSIEEREVYIQWMKDRTERVQERNLKIGAFLALGIFIGLVYLILFN